VVDRADRLEDIHFLVADLVGLKAHRGLHGDTAEELEEVVLHHVPEGAGLLVVERPALDPRDSATEMVTHST
jgi:hypothetical protein